MVSDNAAGSSSRAFGWVATGTTVDEAEHPEGSIPLTTETVCELISNARRRAVIEHVAALDPDERLEMGDLARTIASEEHDIPPATVSAEQRKTVYVSLLQNHLPKLDAAGVVAWNDRSGAVAPGRCVADLATLVEGIDRACDPETA